MNRIPSPILTAGIGLLLVAGCAKRNLTMPTKAGPFVYVSERFGNKETIKEATFIGADGSTFTLKGYTSDQVEALGIVAEAAARGAVQAFTGGAAGSAGTVLPAVANGARMTPASRQTASEQAGGPVIVAGPDGRPYKLLVRNGVVLLSPSDDGPAKTESP